MPETVGFISGLLILSGTDGAINSVRYQKRKTPHSEASSLNDMLFYAEEFLGDIAETILNALPVKALDIVAFK